MTDLKLNEFETACIATDKTYSCGSEARLYHYITGLCAETGEVAELFQMAIREDKVTDIFIDPNRLKDELGDVLWYLTRLANDQGISLELIIDYNMLKLKKRLSEEK